ncbi:hypothetical protein DFP72DRAFT_1082778 [Ephemerocybe angulata]|uniref:Uncharacterized protein n=1 Tax=Ephemerocybe angulata TaxID=980116 RepID=A0A8H6H8S2_9AGAR|nr:hypothetical protein DFP72DRAFT_1082778 [Tulosesus angulatus]
MALYMEQALFGLTVVGMKHPDEGEGIELTLEAQEAADDGETPEQVSRDFARIALPEIVPVPLTLLTKQEGMLMSTSEECRWLLPPPSLPFGPLSYLKMLSRLAHLCSGIRTTSPPNSHWLSFSTPLPHVIAIPSTNHRSSPNPSPYLKNGYPHSTYVCSGTTTPPNTHTCSASPLDTTYLPPPLNHQRLLKALKRTSGRSHLFELAPRLLDSRQAPGRIRPIL